LPISIGWTFDSRRFYPHYDSAQASSPFTGCNAKAAAEPRGSFHRDVGDGEHAEIKPPSAFIYRVQLSEIG
jgi:hypothetical protein